MAKTSRSILIAEDNLLIALEAEQAAEALGYEVAGVVSRVDDALSVLHRQRLDAALVDYELMDGTSEALVDALQANNVPVVLVSAMPRDVLRDKGFASDIIESKPADFGRIIATRFNQTDEALLA